MIFCIITEPSFILSSKGAEALDCTSEAKAQMGRFLNDISVATEKTRIIAAIDLAASKLVVKILFARRKRKSMAG